MAHDPTHARLPWSSLGLDLVTLRVFKAAVEERSLANAAERERLALSAISRRITSLEARLGVDLLRRHDRGVEATAAGKVLMSHIDTLFEVLEYMTVDMEAFAAGRRGQVRILTNLSVLAGSLPEDLASFQKQHPGIELLVEEQITGDIIHSIQIGTAEVGLVSATISAPNLEIIPWKSDHLVAVLPKGHRLDDGEPTVSFERLIAEPFVGLSTAMVLTGLLRREAVILGIHLKERVQVASFDGVRRMIQAGFGVGVLPEGGAKPYAETLGLVTKPLSDRWAERSLGICVRDSRTLSGAAQLLVSHLLNGAAADAL